MAVISCIIIIGGMNCVACLDDIFLKNQAIYAYTCSIHSIYYIIYAMKFNNTHPDNKCLPGVHSACMNIDKWRVCYEPHDM